jgi:2-polyprenyl-6-methoxyphenol hydroxylase-like FAD-dependent oxidoreductase
MSAAHLETDVVVIGASVAGCAAAALYGQQGLRVLLVDRVTDPAAYKKQCSHAIQPAAVPVLERLGVADALEAAGARKSTVQLWTKEGGWVRLGLDGERDESGKRTHGFNIRREKLDPLLRSTAANTKGVTLALGLTVKSLTADATGRFTGAGFTDSAGNVTEVTAKLVVGADGRNTHVAQLADLQPEVKPHNRAGFMAYFRGVRNRTGNDAQFWVLGENVAYSFPTDDGLILLAVMIHERRLPEFRADRDGFMRSIYAQLADGPDLSNAERVSDFIGAANTPNTYRWPAKRGLALVGDAAMASDYIWGVGCGWALQGAELLVDNTAAALINNGDLDAALAAYGKQHKEILHSQHEVNAQFSASTELPALQKAVLVGAATDEKLRQLVALTASGRISQRDLRIPLRLAWLYLTRPFRNVSPGAARTPDTVVAA